MNIPGAVKQVRYLGVAAAIRGRIVAGRWAPGDLLPDRPALAREYGVSLATLQRAMDTLIAEGFLVARGRVGTRVVDQPPHLHDYGLVLPFAAYAGDTQRPFWRSLASAGPAVGRESGRRVSRYFSQKSDTAGFDYGDLDVHVRDGRLAGVVFAMDPAALAGRPAAELAGVPRVALSPRPLATAMATSVWFDAAAFLDSAITSLLAQRRRRLAFLTLGNAVQFGAPGEPLAEAIRRYRLHTPVPWVQAVPAVAPALACPITHLLLSGDARSRPDGLIVTDESLFDEALAGVLAAGREPGRNLGMVAHGSLPVEAPQPGVVRLGYEVVGALRFCLEQIDRLRLGERVSALTMLKPEFAPAIAVPTQTG